ncbi:MAG: 50S ribosomal protein L22 [Candidatus Omnitrophica bacterium]|nr:50S ribosomal protein L22 [Candidatus Omnitrophota bacterium]
MLTRAIARYIRDSPRKTMKVIDIVRGLPVVKAEALLDMMDKKPTIYIKRLLKSAVDSADKRFSVSPADLYISLIQADKGPMLKRYRAMTMGRAGMIKHRTTHITLELERIIRPEKKVVDKDKVTAKKKAVKKPVVRKRKVK